MHSLLYNRDRISDRIQQNLVCPDDLRDNDRENPRIKHRSIIRFEGYLINDIRHAIVEFLEMNTSEENISGESYRLR